MSFSHLHSIREPSGWFITVMNHPDHAHPLLCLLTTGEGAISSYAFSSFDEKAWEGAVSSYAFSSFDEKAWENNVFFPPSLHPLPIAHATNPLHFFLVFPITHHFLEKCCLATNEIDDAPPAAMFMAAPNVLLLFPSMVCREGKPFLPPVHQPWCLS